MATKHGAIVVIGSGPGIGSHVPAKFASQGFNKVVLMSRNRDRLKEDAKRVTDAAPDANVDVVTVDLSNTDDVRRALAEVDEKLAGTPVEFVLYNAARVGPSKLFDWKPEDLEKDLRVRALRLSAIGHVAKLTRRADFGRQSLRSRLPFHAIPRGSSQRFRLQALLLRHKWPLVHQSFPTSVLPCIRQSCTA